MILRSSNRRILFKFFIQLLTIRSTHSRVSNVSASVFRLFDGINTVWVMLEGGSRPCRVQGPLGVDAAEAREEKIDQTFTRADVEDIRLPCSITSDRRCYLIERGGPGLPCVSRSKREREREREREKRSPASSAI